MMKKEQKLQKEIQLFWLPVEYSCTFLLILLSLSK